MGNYCKLNKAMGCIAMDGMPDVAQENRSKGGGGKKKVSERKGTQDSWAFDDMIAYY